MLGRLGGDEFGVLLWNLGEADALAKAAALERAVEATVCEYRGRRLPLGVSIGVTYWAPTTTPRKYWSTIRRCMRASGRGTRRRSSSGDDVGRDLIFDEGDTIAQLQLAFLQALQLQEIGAGRQLQRGDRRVEIAMLLLQAQELCLELTVVFVGHRLQSIKIVSASQAETVLRWLRRSGTEPHAPVIAVHAGFQNAGSFFKNFCGSGDCGKPRRAGNTVGNQFRAASHAAIDSRSQSCTINSPERNQMEVPMAIQAHLAELERKHEALENQLHDALNHPSTDDITILEIKRRKLQVKDEIERLRIASATQSTSLRFS